MLWTIQGRGKEDIKIWKKVIFGWISTGFFPFFHGVHRHHYKNDKPLIDSLKEDVGLRSVMSEKFNNPND